MMMMMMMLMIMMVECLNVSATNDTQDVYMTYTSDMYVSTCHCLTVSVCLTLSLYLSLSVWLAGWLAC